MFTVVWAVHHHHNYEIAIFKGKPLTYLDNDGDTKAPSNKQAHTGSQK